MRAKLVSNGWDFLERILKGGEQFHVPKPVGTNMNIWVQGWGCVSLHKLWGLGLAVFCLFQSPFVSLSVRSLHAGCPNTTTFVVVVLCSLGASASPQLPLFQLRSLFFSPYSEPQHDFFLFSGERKLLHGWQKDLPRSRGC